MNQISRTLRDGLLLLTFIALTDVCVGESRGRPGEMHLNRAEAIAWKTALEKQLESPSQPLLEPFSIIQNVSHWQMIKAGMGFQPLSGEAHSLFVETPGMHEQVQPYTSKTTLFKNDFSVGVSRLSIPIGAWVVYKSDALGCRILIPYMGAERWKFSTDEKRRIWLARNDNDPDLVGFSLRTGKDDDLSLAQQLRDLPLEQVRYTLSFQITEKSDIESLKSLPFQIPLALSSSVDLDGESFDGLRELNLMALQGFIKGPSLERVAEIQTLRMLAFGIVKAEEREGDILEFPKLDRLRHLALMNAVDLVDWPEALDGLPALESLVLVNSTKPVEWKGRPVADFDRNPMLKVLGIRDDECRIIEREAPATAANLEYLHLRGGAFVKGDGDYPGLSSLQKVRYLSISDTEVSIEMLDEWFESGRLSALRDFEGYYVPDFKHCRELEAVYVKQSLDRNRFYDFARFAEAPESLYIFSATRLSRRDFEGLEIPHPGSIRYLNLYMAEIDDVALLYCFKNIERLDIRTNTGRIRELDFSQFPFLGRVMIDKWSELETIQSIATHPAIESLGLSGCRYLKDLGTNAPNAVMRSVYLATLPSLQNLNAVSGMTRCENFVLIDCDSIKELGTILTDNPLRYYYVRKCEHLEDQAERN